MSTRAVTLPTSDVLDRHPGAQVCSVAMHLLGRCEAISGRIRTVTCFADNALVREVLGQQCDGGVLVVDGGGSLRTALLGDQLAGMALANGWAGIIIFGAVRDASALRELELQVKCVGFNPRKSAKTGAGEVDGVVRVGGVEFRPGETVWSDMDGIVVVPTL